MKHRTQPHWLIIALIFTALTACGKKSEYATPASAPASTGTVSSVAGNASGAISSAKIQEDVGKEDSDKGTAASTTQQLSTTALTAAPKGRQLVRTGTLSFSVKDVYLANLAIEDAIAAHDGFVVNSGIFSQVALQAQYPASAGTALRIESIDTSGTIVLRVPSAKAQAFLRSIVSVIDTLDRRSFAANDVQFDLLRQQLEAARSQATAHELAQLSQHTGRIADKNQTIAQRRQAAIDANEAQLAKLTLADQVDFATLTLDVTQPLFIRKTTVVDFQSAQDSHRPSLMHRALQSLGSGWRDLLDGLIDLLAAWPVLLGIVGAVWAWRWLKVGAWLMQYRTPKQTPKQTTQSTPQG